MTEKALRLEFLQRIAEVPFGAVIADQRLLEIMRSDPRCRNVGLVKTKHNNGFMIRAGGREVSYRTAIKRFLGLKHTRTRRCWVASAARSTVQSQITSFRRSHGAGPDVDIDHVNKGFCQLWRDWLEVNEIEESSVRIKKAGRIFILADEAQRKSWRCYHRENAMLEAVSREEHRERTWRRRVAH